MLACVVEGVAFGHAETFHLVAYGVRRVGLQPAAVDVEYLVEHVGYVESKGRALFDVAACGNLVVGEPAAVGEGEFELVAVELRAGRSEARFYLGQGDLAYACQLVAHLFGLEAQLFVVRQVLPFAAAAYAEMFAERFDAHG